MRTHPWEFSTSSWVICGDHRRGCGSLRWFVDHLDAISGAGDVISSRCASGNPGALRAGTIGTPAVAPDQIKRSSHSAQTKVIEISTTANGISLLNLNIDGAVGQTQNPGLWRFGSTKSNRKTKKATSTASLNTTTERWKLARFALCPSACASSSNAQTTTIDPRSARVVSNG